MNQAEDPQEKPGIVVDTDWKAQVEAEREALRKQASGAKSSAGESSEAEGSQPQDSTAGAASQAQSSSPHDAEQHGSRMPPASFSVLTMMLTSQAFTALGMAPGPDGKPLPPQLPIAKHLIDSLAVLEEKTQGNLDEQEKQLLSGSLTELRLAYVAAKKKA